MSSPVSLLQCERAPEVAPVHIWTKSALLRYVGGLSNPSKMPGYGYSLPADECSVWSRLRQVAGSTCSHCYAHKGRYGFPAVQSALHRRLESIGLPLWADVMSELIVRTGNQWFRWHDSGDLQSSDHLDAICRVCRLTPDVHHWLPTREYRIVQEYIAAGNPIPNNLNIRLSAHMVDGPAPLLEGLTASTVSTGSAPMDDSHSCPAPAQGNKCDTCRACWNPDVRVVDYHVH